MFPNYKTEKEATKWTKITEDGEVASPYSPREFAGTANDGKIVALLQYGDWNPDLYGGCEMWRGLHPDGKLTDTGYVKCGSAYVLRVTGIPQVPDK